MQHNDVWGQVNVALRRRLGQSAFLYALYGWKLCDSSLNHLQSKCKNIFPVIHHRTISVSAGSINPSQIHYQRRLEDIQNYDLWKLEKIFTDVKHHHRLKYCINSDFAVKNNKLSWKQVITYIIISDLVSVNGCWSCIHILYLQYVLENNRCWMSLPLQAAIYCNTTEEYII